ncbi:transposable element Tcb1 transposase [Trichonephila clavipes]|nr:transposable element Tcb1 transposase [Trichonephila clavipes]
MQEGTTDRRGRSHPPQCTTSREDRQIVRVAVTDRSVTSRAVAQDIESVTHHSVSARSIRRRLQQSEEVKLSVRLINTTNEWRLVQGHDTPLKEKGDIEDVSSEFDNED